MREYVSFPVYTARQSSYSALVAKPRLKQQSSNSAGVAKPRQFHRSHTLTVLSSEPEIMRFPQGETQTELTV